MEEGRRGIVITVFSTASAVGKTLISINMAAELVREGYRVCLVDLDLQFGDVANYLHLDAELSLADAQKALQVNMEAFNVRDFLTVYGYEGWSFEVLPSPFKLEEAYNISTKAVGHILQQLQFDYDFVVVDTTSAFSELNLTVMDLSTIITFLGIVDFIPTIKNMKIGCDTIHSLGYEANKIRIVLNRSNSKTKIDLEDVEQLLGEPFYHILPNAFEPARKSIQTGVPLVYSSSNALASELRNLVERYTNRATTRMESQEGVSSWFKKIFNG